MTDHILDLSEHAAYLHVRHEQLVIDRKEESSVSVPLKEVASLILAHPQITSTLAVQAGLMSQGGSVIVCDNRNQPIGLMLPTVSHFVQTERIALQASASLPTKKRLWKQIVQEKVRAQADVLDTLYQKDFGLREFADSVRSGDPKNIEAQAARRYWPALFDDPMFRRRREVDDQNRLLNYGYAVLRATVGRAICAVGLHPSLGLHHRNRYNPFCLADDLMEPYRPIVDSAVVEHVNSYGKDAPLDRAGKQAMLEPFTVRYRSENEARTLFDWIQRTASSLAKVFLKEQDRLDYPKRLCHAAD